MPFVTFIYKFGKRSYYGKYVTDYISDDHEGLDDWIRPLVLDGINQFRAQKNLPKLKHVMIGILSFSVDHYIPCYSSEKEYKCFDFYSEQSGYDNKKIYINGKLVQNGNQIMDINSKNLK